MMTIYFRLDYAFGRYPVMEVICDVSQEEDHSQVQFSRRSQCWLGARECAAWVIYKLQGAQGAAAVQRFSYMREPNTNPEKS